jgi:uncharacterized membrane protein SpoIIM required for sporulation
MKPLKTKTQFKEATSYLKESSNYIYFTIILFAISALFGFFYRSDLTFLNKIIEQIILKTQGLNAIELTFFILQNNLQSSFLAVIIGIALGIFPIINAISNGAILGYVFGLTYDISGVSEWWRILPHGIFELPAIFISIGLGIKLGSSFVTNYFKHYWKKRKILIYLPILITIFFSTINALSLESIPQKIPIPLSNTSLIIISFVSNLILFFAIFIIFTHITNKKLRQIQNKQFKHRFYNAMNVFLMIVIPLLIVAAIIEGILIAFLV